MPITLYDAFVPSCQQILGGMRGIVDKAESHAKANGLDASDLIEASLAEDMWPLPWHVRACFVHSSYALGLVPTGEFTPDFTVRPNDWDSMRSMIDETLDGLQKVSPDDLEAISDDHVFFVLGGKRLMEFKVSNFLLSFSQPNFYFHATTFYDILRKQGVALSKRDYTGVPRAIGL